MRIYCGTYTTNPGFVKGALNTGIAVYDLSPEKGDLDKQFTLPHPGNPSFLVKCPKRQFLFSVVEQESFGGKCGGGIICHGWDEALVKWTQCGEVNSGGAFPCHLTLDPSGRFVFATNYGGGSVAMVSVSETGSLELCHLEQHAGRSVHPDRQTAPHPHSALVDPSGEFLFVADLGLDAVKVYRIDRQKGCLLPHSLASVDIPAGSGPRHMVLHPGNGKLYVLNELTATISVLACKYPFEYIEAVATVKTLPDEYAGPPSGAEIAVHPNGRFLYVSNRGHDSLALLPIDPANGVPRLEATYPTGRTPRHFSLSPEGGWLVVGHQDSGTLQACSIDPDSGRLTSSVPAIEEPAVVCIHFGGSQSSSDWLR